nr:hypothetical protein [Halococcus sediminicola]
MVELAFSTNAYTRHTLPEAVERIADHGYAGVEILGDEPHAYFTEFGESEQEELSRVLDGTEMAVSNVNATPRRATTTTRHRRRFSTQLLSPPTTGIESGASSTRNEPSTSLL